MSKKVIAITGLAAALSLLSPGCSNGKEAQASEPAKQEQQANKRRIGNRENIAVSYIARKKDYVKSINLLLSLHREVIPEVRKLYPNGGIEQALETALMTCRMRGKLKENSVAYSFTDLITQNYGTKGGDDKDFDTWSQKFSAAGQEAELILKEPESIHRTFVPASFNSEFLRRPIEVNGKDGSCVWSSCKALERDFSIKKSAQYWDGILRADPRN